MQFLYRFRRTDHLIGEHKELEKQEIYFSSPDELNDPVEGFKDMFWSGDEIIWKNFIKHYLLCLESLCETFLVDGENFLITAAIIPVFKTMADFPTPAYRNLYQEIYTLFFNSEIAAKWPQLLASRKGPIRQNELYAYLKSIHTHALNTIFTVYENHNLMPQRPVTDPLRQFGVKDVIGVSVDWANSQEAQRPDIEDGIERYYAAIRHWLVQDELITLYNKPLNAVVQKNRLMLYGRFPQEYLKCLEKLVHPEWYAAAFTGNCNNPSMWGHYGDGHKGICLIFRTSQIKNEPSIKLQGINGVGGRKDNVKVLRGYSNNQFYKIKYAKRYPEINFFRSLGVLPAAALNECWYYDEHQKKSTCADTIRGNEDVWRKGYWDIFYDAITTKLEDWGYEDEYRLVCTPMMMDFREKSARKFTYQFSDLEGIVFGIKTPEDIKTEIIRIIEGKCSAENRKDFRFYQALYSKKDAHIGMEEIPIKFGQAK